jgi:hypothetical protein
MHQLLSQPRQGLGTAATFLSSSLYGTLMRFASMKAFTVSVILNAPLYFTPPSQQAPEHTLPHISNDVMARTTRILTPCTVRISNSGAPDWPDMVGQRCMSTGEMGLESVTLQDSRQKLLNFLSPAAAATAAASSQQHRR